MGSVRNPQSGDSLTRQGPTTPSQPLTLSIATQVQPHTTSHFPSLIASLSSQQPATQQPALALFNSLLHSDRQDPSVLSPGDQRQIATVIYVLNAIRVLEARQPQFTPLLAAAAALTPPAAAAPQHLRGPDHTPLSLPSTSEPLLMHAATLIPEGPSSFAPVTHLLGLIGPRSAPVICLVDSGASALFMSSDTAARCGLIPTPSGRTIRLADGTIRPSAGTVTASCTMQGQGDDNLSFDAEFCVTELLGHQAILGMPWLAHYNPATNWATGEFTIQRPGHAAGPLTLNRKSNVASERSVSPPAGAVAVSAITAPRSKGKKTSREDSILSRCQWDKLLKSDDVDLSSLELMRVWYAGAEPMPLAAADAFSPGQLHLSAAAVNRDQAVTPQHAGLTALLAEFAEVIPDQLGPVDPSAPSPGGIKHTIELIEGAKPHASPLRRYSPLEDAEIKRVVEEQLLLGRVKESTSPWGAMVLLAKKKDGALRFCVDYRVLNNSTLKNKYALPLADDCFDRARGARVFSKLDLHSGFWQIMLDPASSDKTAFRTRFGHYQYTVLPMGLCNAPGTFMHVMNSVFRKQLDRFLLVFLDDIFIFSANEEEHLLHLREALEVLRANHLYLKPSKCEWMKDQVEFLGHRIGREGLSVDPHKVDAVRDWPVPRDVSQMRSFLGLAGYYRRFITNYSQLTLPLTELTKDDVEWHWDAPEQSAFAQLKVMLSSAPVLQLADPALPYTIHCDASGFATGACLMQDHGEGLQPVSYISSKMNGAETRYAPHEQELLALVNACKAWRHYLHNGKTFTILSDHQSLRFFPTQPTLSSRQARWKDQLAEFDFTIRYIEGPKNVVADALSRRADHKDAADDEVTQLIEGATDIVTKDAFLATIRCAPAVGASSPPPPPMAEANAVRRRRAPWGKPRRRLRKGEPTGVPPARLATIPPTPAWWPDDRVSYKDAAERVLPAAADRPAPNAMGIIRMPTQRCTQDNKKGMRCGARTARGHMCYTHRKQLHGIRIKKSTYGMGLFTTRAHRKHDDVALYSGDLVKGDSDHDGGPYHLSIRIAGGGAIDAARTNTGDGRWANDPRGMKKPNGRPMTSNCRFVTIPGTHTATLRMLRDIAVGEELLVSYGDDYWDNIANWEPSARPPPRARNALAAMEAVAQLSATTIAYGDFELIAQAREAAQRDAEYRAVLASPPDSVTVRDGLIWMDHRLIVPDDLQLRTQLISEVHDTVTGGHFGRDKTQAALRARFDWKGMMAHAAQYVSGCDVCQRVKHSQQVTPGLLMPMPVPEELDSHWTMDFVTGLPRTARGHDAIQGHFSRGGSIKRLIATDVKVDALRAADAFIDCVVRHHGVPASIVSDRGPQFISRVWKALWGRFGTNLSLSTSYHPQTNGLSEREQKTMSTWLKAFCSHHPEDWDLMLPLAELALNCMPQAASGMSPFQLLYGRNPAHSVDRALSDTPPSAESARALADVPAAEARWKRMAAAWTQVRGKLREGQRRMTTAADRHRRELTFTVGDRVLLSTANLKIADPQYNAKLAHLYCGPFTITRVINANAYELDLPDHMSIHATVNVSQLRAYHDGRTAFPNRPRAPGADRPPPESTDSAGQPAYVVERVLAQQGKGRNARYLVLWKGYPYSEATWEPAASLTQAQQAIYDYTRMVSADPRAGRRRGRGPGA